MTETKRQCRFKEGDKVVFSATGRDSFVILNFDYDAPLTVLGVLGASLTTGGISHPLYFLDVGIDGGHINEAYFEFYNEKAMTTTYRALRRITLEFPSQSKRMKIKAGQILTGEVAEKFLCFITEFGPARMPLVLLEPAK